MMMSRRKFAIKYLNAEFELLRSNAIQRKRFQQEQFKGHDDDEDRVRLLVDDDDGPSVQQPQPPPHFVVQSETLVLQLSSLEAEVARLDSLHKTHAAKPAAFADDDATPNRQEEEIAAITREVGQGVARCHQQIKRIKGDHRVLQLQELEAEVARNVVLDMSNRLQGISEAFQRSQSKFLKHLEAREAKLSRLYFDDFEEVSINDDAAASNSYPLGRINTQELIQIEENSKFVEQREREITDIVRSIADLNTVFKELAQMVSDQGSIVDRIDHNVEHAQVKVEEGLKQLKQAEKLQGKNRKMHCIVILAVIFVILLFILIIKIS